MRLTCFSLCFCSNQIENSLWRGSKESVDPLALASVFLLCGFDRWHDVTKMGQILFLESWKQFLVRFLEEFWSEEHCEKEASRNLLSFCFTKSKWIQLQFKTSPWFLLCKNVNNYREIVQLYTVHVRRPRRSVVSVSSLVFPCWCLPRVRFAELISVLLFLPLRSHNRFPFG